MKSLVLTASLVLVTASFAGLPAADEIKLEGDYACHLQDVCYDGTYIYWAHTRELVKTDVTGKIVRRVAVEGHHAGLEVRDGRLYVAVCPMQNTTGGKTTSECRVTVGEYDAETLALVKMHVTDIHDRSGSLAILEDGTFLVGCLRPQDIAPTQVRFHHLDRNFRLIRSYVLDNVPVKLGIETLKRKGDFVYLAMYGTGGDGQPLDFDTIKIDRDFKEVWRGKLGGSCGSFEADGARWLGKTVLRKNADGTHRCVSHLERCTVVEPELDSLQAEIDAKRAEENAADRLAIPPDDETYLFQTMKHGFPKLRKVGAVSPWGECSPFVFKGRLMRMELVDDSRGRSGAGSYAIIRDVASGKVVGRTGEGCYYQSVYAEGDTVYITGTRRQPGQNVTSGDTILLYETKDLVHWTSRELLSRPGWRFYNSTMTKGPDGYVIALESDNLKHARRYFTMFFAASKDMKTWAFLPDEKAYPKQRYCGGPFLKYVDGWYYLSLVQAMPCERWCTYLFRSKDLSSWECGRYNPCLMWDDDDRRVAAKSADITDEFAARIRTGFVCNASDLEFCEFEGKTCLDYLVGDQRGFYYMAEAWYDGPLKEYLERQFE